MRTFNSIGLFIIVVLLLIIIGNITGFHVPCHRNILGGTDHTCGFWGGLWHGWLSPVTFIVGWFNHSLDVWEVNNNGGWYTFGFLLGSGVIFRFLSDLFSSSDKD